MNHSVTPLVGGKPQREPHIRTQREPHIRTRAHDPGRLSGQPSAGHCFCCGRPFESYVAQPDTAERVRLAVQEIPFALPERKPDGR